MLAWPEKFTMILIALFVLFLLLIAEHKDAVLGVLFGDPHFWLYVVGCWGVFRLIDWMTGGPHRRARRL